MNISKDKYEILVKSSLNKHIIKNIENADVAFIENSFAKLYNIDAKFNENKIYAGYFTLILNLFEDLSIKYHLPFTALPPRIRCFNNKNLIKKSKSDAFCLTDTKKVFIDEPPFEMRSIFIKNEDSIVRNASNIYDSYANKLRSSGHFLSQCIHEWCHNIHIDNIMKTSGYDGKCLNLRNYYNRNLKSFPNGLGKVIDLSQPIHNQSLEKEINDTLGKYSSTSLMEFYSEFLTKLITDSLNSKTLLPNGNPLDKLKKYPKNLQKLFCILFEN